MAWLSDSTASPSTRFTRSSVPYVLPDGTTVVANNWADLTHGTLQFPINLAECLKFLLYGFNPVWTGAPCRRRNLQ